MCYKVIIIYDLDCTCSLIPKFEDFECRIHSTDRFEVMQFDRQPLNHSTIGPYKKPLGTDQ